MLLHLGKKKKKKSADLGEGGGSRGHQDLTYSVMEPLHRFIINTQETLCCPLFGYLDMKKNNIKS